MISEVVLQNPVPLQIDAPVRFPTRFALSFPRIVLFCGSRERLLCAVLYSQRRPWAQVSVLDPTYHANT